MSEHRDRFFGFISLLGEVPTQCWPNRADDLLAQKGIEPEPEVQSNGSDASELEQTTFCFVCGDRIYSGSYVEHVWLLDNSPWPQWRHRRCDPAAINSKDVNAARTLRRKLRHPDTGLVWD